jgi:hypothetical protein
MDIMNGNEMLEYDRDPDIMFKERAIEAIEGSTRMGNSPDYANVFPEQQGFTGPTFGKKLVQAIKASVKKREDAGLLPLTVGYFRGYNEIDPKWLKYYNKQENTNPDNDRVTYNIKGEFINTKPLGGTPIPYSSLFKN